MAELMEFLQKNGTCEIWPRNPLQLNFESIYCEMEQTIIQKLVQGGEVFHFKVKHDRGKRYETSKKGSENSDVVIVTMVEKGRGDKNAFQEFTSDFMKEDKEGKMLEIAQILALQGLDGDNEKAEPPYLPIALFTFCAFQSFGDDLIQIVSLLNIEGLNFTIKPSLLVGDPLFSCSWSSSENRRHGTSIQADRVVTKYRLTLKTGAIYLRHNWKLNVLKSVKAQCDKEQKTDAP
eukprot:GHVS01001044.1.p1 GENE.GHVS01001044.1~~GHVS01001044.1.p1  ORF type:complete len:234 (+),score=4.59 GHVS01001044.1:494-1195(+)